MRAIEMDPNYGFAWLSKGGDVLKDLKRYDEAIKCFDRALEIGPSNEFARSGKSVLLQKLGLKV